MYDEDDYLMLSGIQHFCFCKRQWALIHLEQVWEDDDRTASGNIFHEKVDSVSKESRGDLVVRRAVRVSSPSLGVSGRCDVVEFIEDSEGYHVDGMDGLFKVRPVEYKVGHRKSDDCDRMQLCAEAIALEESLHTIVEEGSLYYGKERRREIVSIDDELRSKTYQITEEMHAMFTAHQLPEPIEMPYCRKCSLSNLCLPTIGRRSDVDQYLSRMADE